MFFHSIAQLLPKSKHLFDKMAAAGRADLWKSRRFAGKTAKRSEKTGKKGLTFPAGDGMLIKRLNGRIMPVCRDTGSEEAGDCRRRRVTSVE